MSGKIDMTSAQVRQADNFLNCSGKKSSDPLHSVKSPARKKSSTDRGGSLAVVSGSEDSSYSSNDSQMS